MISTTKKTKTKRIPLNSVIMIIKFPDKDQQYEFIDNKEFQELIGKIECIAVKLLGECRFFTSNGLLSK